MGRPKNTLAYLVDDEWNASFQVLRTLGSLLQQVWRYVHRNGKNHKEPDARQEIRVLGVNNIKLRNNQPRSRGQYQLDQASVKRIVEGGQRRQNRGGADLLQKPFGIVAGKCKDTDERHGGGRGVEDVNWFWQQHKVQGGIICAIIREWGDWTVQEERALPELEPEHRLVQQVRVEDKKRDFQWFQLVNPLTREQPWITVASGQILHQGETFYAIFIDRDV